jgi:hypothetical protein
MRVESAAGAFELKFERIEPGDGDIVLTGQMGVWEAKTHITISEFFAVIRMAMSLRMLGFFLRSLFRSSRNPKETT